jgi:hypothetical protein
VGAIRQAGSAASTVNRFYRRFDRLFSVKIADTVGPVMHTDQVCAARSSPDRRRCFTTTSAGELTIRTLRTAWNGCATKDAEI